MKDSQKLFDPGLNTSVTRGKVKPFLYPKPEKNLKRFFNPKYGKNGNNLLFFFKLSEFLLIYLLRVCK